MNAIDPDPGVGRVSHPRHADWLPASDRKRSDFIGAARVYQFRHVRDLDLISFLPRSCNCRQPMLGIARPIPALALGLKDPGWGYELCKHCREHLLLLHAEQLDSIRLWLPTPDCYGHAGA